MLITGIAVITPIAMIMVNITMVQQGIIALVTSIAVITSITESFNITINCTHSFDGTRMKYKTLDINIQNFIEELCLMTKTLGDSFRGNIK